MSPEKNSHKCFIIHLKRAVQRKKTVQSILSNMECTTQIIDAVDGNTLTDQYISKYINYDKDSVESVMLLINDLILIK